MDFANMTQEQKISAIGDRIVAAQKERADREASANAHEEQAREDRRVMTALKKEIGELATVLQHTQVAKNVNDAHAAALKAKGEAEAAAAKQAELVKELEEKSKKLDELIARAEQPAA